MINHQNHNYTVPDKKASGKPTPGGQDCCFSRTVAKMLYSRKLGIVLIMVAVLAVTFVQKNNADEKIYTQVKSSELTNQTPKNPQEIDNEILRTFMQLSAANEKDPNSPEAVRLTKKLNEAINRAQSELKTDPNADISQLPGGAPPRKPRPVPSPARSRAARSRKPDKHMPRPPKASDLKAKPSAPDKPLVDKVPPIDPVVVEPKGDTQENADKKITDQPDQPDQPIQLDPGYVLIKTKNDIIDINMLLETIGKEMKLNFIYDDSTIPTGKVKLQQHGKIHRDQLLPLLEFILATSDYYMVREGPFIRVVKRASILPKTELFTPSRALDDSWHTVESVVSQMIEIRHSTIADVKKVLGKFVDSKVISDIPDTNYLIITDYARRLPRLLEIIALIDQPGPVRRLEILEPQYITATVAKKQIEVLVKELDAQEVTAKPPAKAPSKKSKRQRKLPSSKKDKTLPAKKGTPRTASMLVDERTNRLFIIGTNDQIDQVIHLLSLYDVAQPGPEIILEPFTVEHAEVADVLSKINNLIQAMDSQKGGEFAKTKKTPASKRKPPRGKPSKKRPTTKSVAPQGPYMLADDRTYRIIVVGSQEQISQVRDLLSLLDIAVPGAEIRLELFTLDHLLAEKAADQLSELIKALSDQEQSDPKKGTTKKRTTSKAAAKKKSSKGFVKTTGQGPFLIPELRTNRLLVIGNDEQIDLVDELLALLDVDKNLKLIPIQIENVLVTDIASQLSALIRALTEQDDSTGATGASPRPSSRRRSSRSPSGSRGGIAGLIKIMPLGPYMLPDERTNRLLIVSTDEYIDMIMDLLPVLDVPSSYDKMILRIYRPQYVEAAEVLKILDDLNITKRQKDRETARERARRRRREAPPEGARPTGEGGVIPGMEEPEIYIAIQESTNRIFIYATEYQLSDIDVIMKEIDLDPNDTFGQYEIVALENQEPSFVANALAALLETERLDKDNKMIPAAENAPIVVALEDTYSIGIRGSAKQREEIKAIIKELDRRLSQVLVEAILVQVNESEGLDIGVSLKESYGVRGTRGDTRRISATSPFNVGTIAKSGNIVSGTGATLAFFNNDFVYATLEALQTQHNAKILSRPRITVNDNEEGIITNERMEPTTTITIQPGSDTTVETFKGYETAGTTLTIRPHISESNFLRLEITLNVDSFDGESSGAIPPPKTKNEISTVVTVPDNMTVILGGLTTQTDSTTVSKIPILGDLPILGALFRKVSTSQTKGVLYVFVKAQIIHSLEDQEGVPDFGVLDRISEKYRKDLTEKEINFQQQPIIPGFPGKTHKSEPLFLDE